MRIKSIFLALMIFTGCTRESVRLALENQHRADQVQQTIFDCQHEGLRTLLFHDLEARLTTDGQPLSDSQAAALNQAWNDRDLFEFWAVQQERSKALRLAGVDARLAADQSVIDLLLKQVEAGLDRGKQSLAASAGSAASQPVSP